MNFENFEIEAEDKKLYELCKNYLKEKIENIRQVCQRYGDAEDEVRKFNVYIINTPSGSKILKKLKQEK